MKQQRLRSIGSCARPALLLALAGLAMAPGLSVAALSLDFASPATNGSYGADFVGDFTYGPGGHHRGDGNQRYQYRSPKQR